MDEESGALLYNPYDGRHIRGASSEVPDPTPVYSPGFEKSHQLAPSRASRRPSLTSNSQRIPTRHGITFAVGAILLSLVLGALVAVAHHFFNARLDGEQVEQFFISQAWTSHLNTGLAYAVKAAFVASVLLSLQQVFWRTVRRRFMPLGAIDGAASIDTSPKAFMNPATYTHFFSVVVIAGISYGLPVAAIFSPGSLGVASRPIWASAECTVPGVDLASSTLVSEGYSTSPWFTAYNGQYLSPSYSLSAIALRTLSSGQPVSYDSPCGPNCTYTVNFNAPSLSCQDEANSVMQNPYIYWLAYNTPANGTGADNLNATYQIGTSGDGQATFQSTTCVAYNTTYAVKVSHINNAISFAVTSAKTHDVIDTPSMSTQFATNQDSGENASTFADYSIIAIKDAIAQQLVGSISASSNTLYITSNSNVYLSPPLVSSLNWTSVFFSNVKENFQSAMINMSLSALSLHTSHSNTTCSTFPYQAVYTYTPRTLWIPYAAAFGVTLLCACAGIVAIISNGGGEEPLGTLSVLIARTRNESLDELATISRQSAAKVQLRFGILPHMGRPAFGLHRDFET